MIVVNKQQYLKELAKLTLVNILNCPNGIIRRQYENKLKQKRKGNKTMKVNNTVCKKCDGWGEIEKENKLLPCNNCDGDYFYNLNGVPINQRDRGYQLNNGWKHDRT